MNIPSGLIILGLGWNFGFIGATAMLTTTYFPAERGREGGRIGVRERLDCTHLHLQASAVALDPAEYAHRVSLGEALVQEVDVLPHARLDASARIDELEREVWRATTRSPALLARDGEDAIHGPILRELRDRGHGWSLRRGQVLHVPWRGVRSSTFRAWRGSGLPRSALRGTWKT